MRFFPLFLFLFSLKAFSADSSNVLQVDGTFFIQLSLFIFIILFLNKFLFQPLLNLKEDRDIETSVRIERAQSMREQSEDLDSEYKKRLLEFKLEVEQSSNEQINEARRQADMIIKEAKDQSIHTINEARKNLNSELISSVKNMSINEIKASNDDISLRIKEISNLIRSKVN
jgi:F-type H+-transporting ATPase subunit b